MKQVVLNSGHFLFDNKPMIVKPWVPDIELIKEEVKTVPAWVRLHKLPLKFWGKSLVKLANLVGSYVKCDTATEQKARLDEKQKIMEIEIGYEWKPTMCSTCKQLGHDKETCRKGQTVKHTQPKKVWKPVQKVVQIQKAVQIQKPAQAVQQQVQQPAKKIKFYQTIPEVVQTPETKIGPSSSGSLSPIKVTRQGPKMVAGLDMGLFGLLDAKIKPSKVNKVVVNVFNDLSVSTNSAYHPGGRIWVVWKPHLCDVLFLDYAAQLIQMKIMDKITGMWFYYTDIYAFNGIGEREPLWDRLNILRPQGTEPWLLGGDFNCVLQAKERLGGGFNMAEAKPFQQCLEECEVMDIQAAGSYYTWNNKQPLETRVYSRLDRALVNQSWIDQFPNVYANFLPEGHFDHNPCMIGMMHYEGTQMFKVTQKLRRLKPELRRDKDLLAQEYTAHQHSIQLQQAKTAYLKQKAKAHWLVDGDTNSSYFHGLIKARRNKNCIYQIRDHKGIMHSDEDGIQQAFFEYYEELLGSNAPTIGVKNVIIQKGKKCTKAQRQILLAPVTQEEVKEIIFNISDDKAPGPDGYSSKFFKDSWDIVGGEDIIRLYERKASSPRCLFKLDLQKAYDTVEWGFLAQLLKAMNFPSQFTQWTMQCVTTASYSLNLNGNLFGFFKGKRGLRQGDPLSPLLFTICMDYLSRFLSYSTETPDFHFHPLGKPMKLSHLMFADDLLLFSKGDAHSMMILLRTFSTFSKSSGLNMSKGKSNAFFNGVPKGLKNDILQVSGMVEGRLPFKYLRVPIKTTRLFAQECKPIIDRVVDRIRGLGARKLSYAGRLVLVNVVLKTLHNYWATMNFLWDGGTEFIKSPLVSWEKACKPRDEGGLGLKNDVEWNKAAIGKLVWWIASKSDHLWVR
ncbi:uncharacterized protein LOC141649137 [Silene latifolia]|uniref:uncharacterized protein LOC141649137 n=1 Tax=Silene latifolia TaxID=37657 RepID=UPI003D77C9EC